jgi:D-hydroxyproline dehydrogenase subunit beta
MTAAFDSVVVGAGIVGSACALALVRKGMRVALVDPAGVGQGATAAGMGHVVIMDHSPAQFRLTHYSQQLWQGLARAFPPECEYRQPGTIWIASSDEEMEEAVRKHALYGEFGVLTEVLSSSKLRQLEPNLRSGLAGALLVPSDLVVSASAVAGWLVQQSVAAGATLIEDRALSIGHGAVRLLGAETLISDRIVNAAGVDAGELTPGLPIRRRKGHLAIADHSPGLVNHQLAELGYLKSAHAASADSVAFNLQPRAAGHVLIGSSRQFDAESGQVEPAILSRMIERAVSYMPALELVRVERAWAGFRAATPDNLPIIGPWPSDDTVFLAAGHEGLGITTSLGTAELLAAQLCGEPCPIPIEPYLPSRFEDEVRPT